LTANFGQVYLSVTSQSGDLRSETMPSDVKAILSVVAALVAVGFAFWEDFNGKPHLFWFVIGFAIFAVIAMWVFPEAQGGKPPAGEKSD
jgi:hypothetical protein